MSIIETKNKILSLIEHHKQLIIKQQNSGIPSNYAEVQQAAFLKELDNEIEKLSGIFSNSQATIESLQKDFRKLCLQRDEQNQNTCLSFTAMPEGVCNRLYIDIANILIKPTRLDEMLALLMPSIKDYLMVEISDFLADKKSSSQSTVERMQVALQPKPVSSLAAHDFDSSTLTQSVMGDNVIFMMESAKQLPLEVHRKLYKLLEAFPTIKQKLYQHNDDFKQLLFDIALLEKNGLTPNDVLTQFVNELTRSGNRYQHTGNIYAANSVTYACVQFRDYIDQLPEELKQELLALQTPDQLYSLQKILDEHLAQGDCVEQAATRIKRIQENQQNKAILVKRPSVTEEQFNKLKTKYRKPLSVTGFETTKVLPKALRKSVLKNCKITSANDYIDLFINLPATEYEAFLTDAKITCIPALPEELGAVLEMLDEEQRAAFLAVLISQREKFGGIEEVMRFCVKHKIISVLREALQLIPEHKLANLMRKRATDNISLIHYAIKTGTPEIFHILWERLTRQERLSILTTDQDKVLWRVVLEGPPEIFNTLWNCLSENDQLALVQAKDLNRETLLRYAAKNKNLNAFKTMWARLSEKDKRMELDAQSISGNTLLHIAARYGNSEIVALIFAGLTKFEQAASVQVKNYLSNTPLHFAAVNPNPDFLKALWGYLTEQEQLAAIQAKNVDDSNTFLYLAASHIRMGFSRIWEALSEPMQLIAINEKNKEGNTPLYGAISADAENFTLMWNSLSSKNKLIAMREKNNDGQTLLHRAIAVKNLDIFSSLLEHADTNDLLTKDNEGNHLLRCAFAMPEMFKRLWERLSAQEQRLVMQDKQKGSLLHAAIKKNNPEIFFILWESLSEEDRWQACHEESADGLALLLSAIGQSHPDVWQVVWSQYSDEERFIAINSKSQSNGFTLLHWALNQNNLIAFRTIFEFIPPQHRLRVIYEKNNAGKNILYSAVTSGKTDFFNMIWRSLSTEERRTAFYEKNKEGESLLISATRYASFSVFRTLLECLSEQEIAAAFQEKSVAGLSVLNYVVSSANSEKFSLVWEHLSSQERIAAFNEKDNTGVTLLESLVKNTSFMFNTVWNHLSQQEEQLFVASQANKLLYWILEGHNTNNFFSVWKRLSPDERFTVIMKTREDGKTLLHLAMQKNRRIFNTLWKFLSKQERLLMVQKKDDQQCTLLHLAIQDDNPDLFHTFWRCLSEQQQANALKEKTDSGANYLHFAAQKSHPEIWQTIWNLYSPEERREAIFVQQNSKSQNTALHFAVKGNNAKAVQIILEFLPEQERLNALLVKDASGLSSLDYAIENHTLFAIIWDCLTQSDQLKVVQSSLANDINLFQLTAQTNVSSFKARWDLYSETQRSIIIRQKIKNKDVTLAQLCVEIGQFSFLAIVLDSLSEQEGASLILDKDKKGNTLLNLAAQKSMPKTTQTILYSLSESNRLIALKEKDLLGDTLLHYLAANKSITILRIILRFVPVHELFAFLTEKNELGATPLHLAAQNANPLIWSTMMEHLSESERLLAADELCACGYTPLQRAVENNNPETLKTMLQAYPELQRLKRIDRLEDWAQKTCSRGVDLEVIRKENEKLQETRKIAPKISALGFFSPVDGSPSGNTLTPLQSSLLEGVVEYRPGGILCN